MLAISRKEYENDQTVSYLIVQTQSLLQKLKLGAGDDTELLYSIQNCVHLIQGKIAGKYDDRFKGVSQNSTFLNNYDYQQELADLRSDLPPLSPMSNEED